ncbi:hypothetical protein PINS_up012356 [Pythium insidiosum]|nr:hypothetical protein PINS_up012356 [Pythium insidiosum]
MASRFLVQAVARAVDAALDCLPDYHHPYPVPDLVLALALARVEELAAVPDLDQDLELELGSERGLERGLGPVLVLVLGQSHQASMASRFLVQAVARAVDAALDCLPDYHHPCPAPDLVLALALARVEELAAVPDLDQDLELELGSERGLERGLGPVLVLVLGQSHQASMASRFLVQAVARAVDAALDCLPDYHHPCPVPDLVLALALARVEELAAVPDLDQDLELELGSERGLERGLGPVLVLVLGQSHQASMASRFLVQAVARAVDAALDCLPDYHHPYPVPDLVLALALARVEELAAVPDLDQDLELELGSERGLERGLGPVLVLVLGQSHQASMASRFLVQAVARAVDAALDCLPDYHHPCPAPDLVLALALARVEELAAVPDLDQDLELELGSERGLERGLGPVLVLVLGQSHQASMASRFLVQAVARAVDAALDCLPDYHHPCPVPDLVLALALARVEELAAVPDLDQDLELELGSERGLERGLGPVLVLVLGQSHQASMASRFLVQAVARAVDAALDCLPDYHHPYPVPDLALELVLAVEHSVLHVRPARRKTRS